MNSAPYRWVMFVVSAAFCAAMAWWVREHGISHAGMWAWYAAASVVIALASHSIPLVFESGIFVVVWYTAGGAEYPRQAVLMLPLAAMTLMAAAFETRLRLLNAIVLPACVVWVYAANGQDFSGTGWYGWTIVGVTAAQLLLFAADGTRKAVSPPKKIDLILNSYSGNTAHYAKAFGEGLKEAGAEVALHRVHYHDDFDLEISGDALVVAFPVSGWKPPWTLCKYIMKRLPAGKGRPVFILYSAGGGPENTGIVAWILLRLRGWRPIGRAWSVYPLNVVTFRLGPKFMWRWLDNSVPFLPDLTLAKRYATEFARGETSGQPMLIWAFPLVPLGFLFENEWVNLFAYRARAWKRRCNGCGKCALYCPAGRLTMIDGRPRAKGTCDLCFGCVNLCPQRAMQLVAWTEYGNIYKPRFPELVVKHRKTAPAADAPPQRNDPA